MRVVRVKTPRFCVYIESVHCARFDGASPGGEMWRGGEQCACAKMEAQRGKNICKALQVSNEGVCLDWFKMLELF